MVRVYPASRVYKEAFDITQPLSDCSLIRGPGTDMLLEMLQNSWAKETREVMNDNCYLFKSLSFAVFHYTDLGNWKYRFCVCLIFCIEIWSLFNLGFLIFVSYCGSCLSVNIDFLFILLSSTLLEHSAINSLSAVTDFFI